MKWFYERGNESLGPVSTEGMIDLIQAGALTADTLVWNSTLTDWIAADQSELAPYFHAVPGADPEPPVRYVASQPQSSSYGSKVPEAYYASPSGRSAFKTRTPVRSGGIFTLLWLFTCGIYPLYLIYSWANEVDAHLRSRGSSPVLMLLLSIFTCGLATPFILVQYASRINKAISERDSSDLRPVSVPLIIFLYVGVFVLAIGSSIIVLAIGSSNEDFTGIVPPATNVLMTIGGVLAFWQVQAGLNRLSTSH